MRLNLQQVEAKNESLKSENVKLKAENKQFYGEFSIVSKELDEQYELSSLDTARSHVNSLKANMAKLILSNQVLNKQLCLSSENIKYLQKINLQNRQKQSHSSTDSDQAVIVQSLESELERERKVRIVIETDKHEVLNQLKSVKEKSQTLISSLRQKNEQLESDLKRDQAKRREAEELKTDFEKNLKIQEDLVRLVQSLQIELINLKMQNSSEQKDDSPTKTKTTTNAIVDTIRCQHEDDFDQCQSCETTFLHDQIKHRCMQCCKIFCGDCTSNSVNLGPNLRPHKVCALCHALLVYCK
jgi:Rab GTPase-binding effector protein 1